ncbi:MAG TPA: HdeD family acid-resistance protein [Candidatus Limnocylindrales bacterium]|nr:HdeD family acid-resistance protein [Candidatus Limnocylindrales bacterium]
MAITVNEASAVLREATRETIRKQSIWYLVQGLLLVVAGIVALMAPLFASTFVIVFLGWLLIVAGIAQAIGLIGASQVHYFWLQLISAVLAVVVGWMLVSRPEAGLLAAALLMVVYFMVDGIQRLVFALMIRPMRNWGWMLASGVMGILLSLILAANLPGAADWLIGVLLGIELISVGAAMAFLAWDIRRATA